MTMHGVKFGLFLPTGDFPKARAAAEWADRSGFYSISMNDHFFSPLGTAQTPQLECFSTLSALAAITQNVRLAPAVTAVAFRTPAMLAKIASTLDHLSNGRLIMGLGAGWQRSEYDAHGYPYPSNLERIAAEAQLINMIPPIVNGKDFVQDPAAAVKFDKAELKRRIAMLHGFLKAAGRDTSSVELSVISMGSLSR